ncbi:MAG: hypothetical protein M8467_08165 [Anaerolineae bacterium]|nr:hypothetical protein [Anaerolineae bacterium]
MTVTANAECAQAPSPHSAIDGRRLVGYYGTPLGRGLGILGRENVTDTLKLLIDQLSAYEALDPCVETVPVFHMVTTVADDWAGRDGDYSHRVPHDLVQAWIDKIRAAGGLAVLDIQPGQADLDAELEHLEPLLLQPGVHLAVDPEFVMGEGQIPGKKLGHVDGQTVNEIQSWLAGVAERAGEPKILVIHQFDNRMVSAKEEIVDQERIRLVWDADGFGGQWAKMADYHQYRDEGGFEYGAFKIFYNYDRPVLEPAQVLALEPPPAYIIYQ